MNHSLVDTIAGSTLAGLLFTATWWGISTAPDWLLVAGMGLLCVVGALLGLAGVAACIAAGRSER